MISAPSLHGSPLFLSCISICLYLMFTKYFLWRYISTTFCDNISNLIILSCTLATFYALDTMFQSISALSVYGFFHSSFIFPTSGSCNLSWFFIYIIPSHGRCEGFSHHRNDGDGDSFTVTVTAKGILKKSITDRSDFKIRNIHIPTKTSPRSRGLALFFGCLCLLWFFRFSSYPVIFKLLFSSSYSILWSCA